MIANLIGILIVAACLLFTLSLPISGTGFGKTLRQWALFCFIAALAPSVFVGACRQVAGTGGAGGAGESVGCASMLGVLVALSLLAFVILKVRALFNRPNGNGYGRSDHGGQRSPGKRSVYDRERAHRDDEFED
ncbi:MAG: hypothetical protein ABIT01_02045 [Thermoanaerobaculia bacterium]